MVKLGYRTSFHSFSLVQQISSEYLFCAGLCNELLFFKGTRHQPDVSMKNSLYRQDHWASQFFLTNMEAPQRGYMRIPTSFTHKSLCQTWGHKPFTTLPRKYSFNLTDLPFGPKTVPSTLIIAPGSDLAPMNWVTSPPNNLAPLSRRLTVCQEWRFCEECATGLTCHSKRAVPKMFELWQLKPLD